MKLCGMGEDRNEICVNKCSLCLHAAGCYTCCESAAITVDLPLVTIPCILSFLIGRLKVH